MPSPSPRMTLLTASGVCALIVLDTNIVAVTLPSIARDLGAGFADIEWVVSAYMLAFAALLLPAGSLADRFGRKKMLLTGLVLFILASVGCGAAPNILLLDIARAVKGVGAALLLTSALATIGHVFHDETERAKAWAFWGACMGVAMTAAPTVGGLIAELAGWRWIFYLNLPVGLALMGLVVRNIGESRNEQSARLDPWGSLFFSASLLRLIWGLIEANRIGWDNPLTFARLFGGAVLLGLFVLAERLQSRPMIDLQLFRHPRFIGALLGMFAYAGCAQVMMTLLPFYLQNGLGFSAIDSGLGMLPFAITMLLCPRLGPGLSRHLSPAAMSGLGADPGQCRQPAVCLGDLHRRLSRLRSGHGGDRCGCWPAQRRHAEKHHGLRAPRAHRHGLGDEHHHAFQRDHAGGRCLRRLARPPYPERTRSKPAKRSARLARPGAIHGLPSGRWRHERSVAPAR